MIFKITKKKYIFLIIPFLICINSISAFSLDWNDLIEKDGIVYNKFTNKPYTGDFEEFYPSTGKTKQKGKLKDGIYDGKWIFYYENGNMSGIEHLKNGKMHGKFSMFYPNGQLASKGNWKNDKEHGDWIQYFESGEIGSKSTYKNGKANGPQTGYHKNGNLKYQANYSNGLITGAFKQYFSNGELCYTKIYNKGKFLSESKNDENGIITVDKRNGSFDSNNKDDKVLRCNGKHWIGG